MYPESGRLQYTMEYLADSEDGTVFSWEMDAEAEHLWVGYAVTIYQAVLQNGRKSTGGLAPYYEKTFLADGVVTMVDQEEERGVWFLKAKISEEVLEDGAERKNSAEKTESDLSASLMDHGAEENTVREEHTVFIIEVSYGGEAVSGIIPLSWNSIIAPMAEQDSSAVYTIRPVEKVWGTEYQIERKPIFIAEENGYEAGITNILDEGIVYNAAWLDWMGLKPGDAVRIVEAEKVPIE